LSLNIPVYKFYLLLQKILEEVSPVCVSRSPEMD